MSQMFRQNADRRAPDRRQYKIHSGKGLERRNINRRCYLDRRGDLHWHYSWLRISISNLLTG